MGLLNSYQEQTEVINRLIDELPLEPIAQPLEKYPSETFLFLGFILIGYLTYRMLRHRISGPLNRLALLALIPGYIISSIYLAHDLNTCSPFKCRQSLWEVISWSFDYEDLNMIVLGTVCLFIIAFFFDQTILKLIRWVKHG